MRRRGALVLLGLAGYGLSTAAAGIVLAVQPFSDTATSLVSATEVDLGGPGLASPMPSLPPGGVGAQRSAASPSSTSSATPTRRKRPQRAADTSGQLATFVPTRLVLPSGRQAPVKISGVSADGSLIVPERPDVVGWWDGGAHAGDPAGSLVIAGHVDSRTYGLGALYELKSVRIGALVELQAGRQRLRYRVQQTVQVNQQSLAGDDQFFRQDGPHRLVLITCGGPFDLAKRRYRDNYIVVATPV